MRYYVFHTIVANLFTTRRLKGGFVKMCLKILQSRIKGLVSLILSLRVVNDLEIFQNYEAGYLSNILVSTFIKF